MQETGSLNHYLAMSMVLSAALSGAMVIVTVLGVVLARSGARGPADLPALLVPALVATGVLSAVAGVLLFRRERGELAGHAGVEAPGVLQARLLRARILGLALVEVPAIFGLILTLFTGDPVWCLGLGGLALAVSFLLWPRRRELARLEKPEVPAPIEPS